MKKRKTIVITALFAVALCGLDGSARAGLMAREEARPEFSARLSDMASKTQVMMQNSLDALVNLDATRATEVRESDDEVDELNRTMYDEVKNAIQADPKNLNIYVHYLSAARNLERIADHCTNIAKDIIYMVEGRIVRHRASIGNR